MNSITATPQYHTRILCMTPDEHKLLTLALEYTLYQLRYDTQESHYYLKHLYPQGMRTVLLPEELDVLEGVTLRIVNDPDGRDEA